MPWNDGLLPEQQTAAAHLGTSARLLAGPGTGKTRVLMHRVLYLINERHVDPNTIVALTFTRAATQELRNRLASQLPADLMPPVSTLHAFALRQLLRNSHRLEALPKPLRIADSWEERHVILEHMKTSLNHARIEETRELFSKLSADWETLQADADDWTPDPRFLAQWQSHRTIFGYTLRAELTYQLKRAMETVGDFQVESPIAHLIVDEYQDLNKCDLAVIAGIVAKAGCELFIAGDDDQSIYGFRKAHPEGIRSFATQYPGSASLELTICKRCDPPILSLGEFVAQLDPHRLAKTLSPDPARRGGEVRILRFPSQTEEAQSIATIVRRRIDVNGITPGDVLILLRSDRNGAYSSVLKSALELRGIPVASTTEQESALDTNAGRVIVNFLRLLESDSDDLALFQVIRFRANQIGAATVGAIYQIAQARTVRFSEALSAIESAPEIVDRGEIVQTEVRFLRRLARTTLPDFQVEQPDIQTLEAKLTQLLASLHAPGIESDAIKAELLSLAARSNLRSLASLLKAIQETEENIEQERDPQKVNILTMHRAKGLTSHTVFIVAAENEVVPGKNYQEPGLGDERRLLYVSLTRAEHELIITHCDQRFGQQMMQGANAGNRRRTLTQFLRDCPVHSTDGLAYVRTLAPPA